MRVIQAAQNLAQRHVVAGALENDEPFELSRFLRLLLRVPVLRDVPARLIAYAVWPARLKDEKRKSVGDVGSARAERLERWGKERVL